MTPTSLHVIYTPWYRDLQPTKIIPTEIGEKLPTQREFSEDMRITQASEEIPHGK